MNKILIVEDDPSIKLGLKEMLLLESFNVIDTENGIEGIKLALSEHPDVILLDVNLPSENGLEVCRKLREQNFINPIIFLTSRNQDIDKIIGLELGANDYITKPFSIHELRARIHSQLRNKERLADKTLQTDNSEPVRKLMAVMFTDIKDYSLKMNMNETHTLDLLNVHNSIMKNIIPLNKGKIVEITGDGFLVSFDSAIDSVICACEIQRSFSAYNHKACAEDIIEVRIGIHMGDVFDYSNNIKGDVVNIAARIQQNATAGNITISESVYNAIHNKINQNMEFIGEYSLKNIQDTVRLYNIKI